MTHSCFQCGKALDISSPSQVGFREECDSCGSDIHCCKNCKFHDVNAYNECKEPQAERQLEKERANRCDYFSIGSSGGSSGEDKAKTMKDLDDLFK